MIWYRRNIYIIIICNGITFILEGYILRFGMINYWKFGPKIIKTLISIRNAKRSIVFTYLYNYFAITIIKTIRLKSDNPFFSRINNTICIKCR